MEVELLMVDGSVTEGANSGIVKNKQTNNNKKKQQENKLGRTVAVALEQDDVEANTVNPASFLTNP